MARLLDTDLGALQGDMKLFDRVIRAIQMDLGDASYADAYSVLTGRGMEGARSEGRSTLGAALEWAGADSEYVAQTVTTLEQRDSAVESAYEKAAGPILLERTDAQGMVLLDQGSGAARKSSPRVPSGSKADPLSADVGKVLADPQEFERRLARIRTAQPGLWDADEGRERFRADDKLYAEAGSDIVRTAERPHELAAARGQADRVAAKLDQAIANAADKRSALKALDREIAQLTDGKREERDRLKTLAADAEKQRLKLLDKRARVGKKKAKKQRPRTLDDRVKRKARKLDKRVRKRLRRLGRPESDYAVALDQEMRGEPMPAAAGKAPAAPQGVLPDSQDLHKKITKYMVQNNLPESEYAKVLDQVVQGQVML